MTATRRVFFKFLLCALVTSLLLPQLAAQTEMTGQTSGGAYYRIVVPDGWTPAQGLVIWNHGFSLDPIAADPDLGPLADVQLAEGYAVAASSYSLSGYSVFETVQDLEDLFAVFQDSMGVPDQVYLYGGSLGGIVTAQAIEQANLGNVVGAMSICGAVGGSRIWDSALDLRLVYDVVCNDVPGAAIPGGATGLPFPPDPTFDATALGAAVHSCTGILLDEELRTQEQKDRLAILLGFAGIPESFLLTDMGFVTFGLADLTWDPRKLAGGMAMDNRSVDYGDATINASIARVQADQDARRLLRENYTPSGKVGDVKIISLHTDQDGLIIVENESEYADAVPAKNLTVGVVVEEIPTHCGFTDGEVVASWEALRGWVAGLPQPTPGQLQSTCEGIVLGDLANGPCRIDPNFVIADLDVRSRPRETCVADDSTLCLGENGRFRVAVNWEKPQGETGTGGVADAGSTETGSFYFFNPDNYEMLVKSLDGRQLNGKFWIFYGSLTNVAFEMTVTDTDSALVKTYVNPQGNFGSVGDTSAF